MTQDREASESTMDMEWRSPRGSARTRCGPPIPSCLGMKIRSLVVYNLNDCLHA